MNVNVYCMSICIFYGCLNIIISILTIVILQRKCYVGFFKNWIQVFTKLKERLYLVRFWMSLGVVVQNDIYQHYSSLIVLVALHIPTLFLRLNLFHFKCQFIRLHCPQSKMTWKKDYQKDKEFYNVFHCFLPCNWPTMNKKWHLGIMKACRYWIHTNMLGMYIYLSSYAVIRTLIDCE